MYKKSPNFQQLLKAQSISSPRIKYHAEIYQFLYKFTFATLRER